MKLRVLTAEDVRAALPMTDAIEAMRSAFGQLSAGKVEAPLRSSLTSPAGVSLFMPAFMRESGDMAVKIVSVYEGNAERGLPVVPAVALVLDSETGFATALMDAASLTALRTGAAGGLAAQLLAREDAETVALFGAGVQARSQIEAALAVRPVRRVYIKSRTRARAEELAAELGTRFKVPEVEVVEESSIVREADIVIAATTSSTPVFDGADLQPGTHVTGVGSFTPTMQEVDATTVHRARVVVDSREACLAEAGDIILAGGKIDCEIGEIVNGARPPRRNDEEITFFKSVGVAAQDAVAAAAILRRAEEEKLGKTVEM